MQAHTNAANENMSLLTAFMTERRYFDGAIITTVTAILAANGALLGVLQFLSVGKFGKLIPFIGIASVLIGAFTVRLHRNRLEGAESDGYTVQEFLAAHIELAVKPFKEPSARVRFSAPDMVNIAILILWVGVLSLHIPLIESFVEKIVNMIFG